MSENDAETTLKELLENPLGSWAFSNKDLVAAYTAKDLIETQVRRWEAQIEALLENNVSFKHNTELMEISKKKSRAEAILREFKTIRKTDAIFNFRGTMVRRADDWHDKTRIYIDPLGFDIPRGAELTKQSDGIWAVWLTIKYNDVGAKSTHRLLIGDAFSEPQAVHAGCCWVSLGTMAEPLWSKGSKPAVPPKVEELLDKVKKPTTHTYSSLAQLHSKKTTKKDLSAVTSPATVPTMPSPARVHFIKQR